MVWFQDSILKHMYHHTLFNMLSNGIFEAHCAQILSCSGPRASAWFIVWPIFPSFRLASLIFSITFWIWLGLPHPSITCIFHCVCTHPIDPMGIHFLCCAHGNECTWTHDVIHVAIVWDAGFNVGREQIHVFLLNCLSFNSLWPYWIVVLVDTKNTNTIKKFIT